MRERVKGKLMEEVGKTLPIRVTKNKYILKTHKDLTQTKINICM